MAPWAKAHASSGGDFSRNGLVCWLWGSSQADGCHCNPGNPPQWKRVTKLSLCTHTDPYNTVSVLPWVPGWSVSFPNEGSSQQGEGTGRRMVLCWTWGASCGRGHWELLSLRLLSPCTGCLIHRVLVSQSFLGMGGCCEQGEWECCTFRAIAAVGCSASAIGTRGMCAEGLRCVCGHTSLLRV